jgi:hypothetical protein
MATIMEHTRLARLDLLRLKSTSAILRVAGIVLPRRSAGVFYPTTLPSPTHPLWHLLHLISTSFFGELQHV